MPMTAKATFGMARPGGPNGVLPRAAEPAEPEPVEEEPAESRLLGPDDRVDVVAERRATNIDETLERQ